MHIFCANSEFSMAVCIALSIPAMRMSVTNARAGNEA
jgi:hypothetical protein